jgi:autotransporter-associated beta strand protein
MIRHRLLRCVLLEDRLAPAIATWDGGGANNLWMTAANWVGDVAPNSGDDLVFPASAARLTNTNDFAAGTAFNSLAITGGGYTIGGNGVTLTDGVTANIGGNSTLGIDLAGTGGLTKSGFGNLTLSGNNSYLGMTFVHAGAITATTSTAFGAVGPGNETIISDPNPTTNASVELLGGVLSFAEPFVLGEISQISTFGDITITAPITLSGDASGLRTILLPGGTSVRLTIVAGITDSGGPCKLTLDANIGQIVFSAASVNSYTGPTGVGGTVIFNGQGPFGAITSSSDIQGTGAIGPLNLGGLTTEDGLVGNLDPGTTGTIGTLATGDLQLRLGGTLDIDAAPTGVDKLNVHGIVQLDGYLALRPTAGFAPTIGTHYRLIDNDGAEAVIGSFVRLPEGAVVRSIHHVALRITYHGGDGNDVELIGAKEQTALAVGADVGSLPVVKVFGGNGALLSSFNAYDPAFRGGVRVATGDVNGDGIDDIITAPGPGGGPDIRVFDGVTFTLTREFLAYSPAFVGGEYVGAGDINGDGRDDIITGAGKGGGPHVRVFSGVDNSVIASFLAYDRQFTGGVTVASFQGKVLTGPGPGGGPDVRVFSFIGTNAVIDIEFLAFGANFFGGVFIASTPGIGTTRDNLIVSAGAGGGPHVKVFAITGPGQNPRLTQLTEFFAYAASFTGGVRVAGADINGDGVQDIVTGAGPGGGPHVEGWNFVPGFGNPPTLVSSFFAFDPSFTGGIYVG